jgi:hypothetical protein
LLHDIAIYRFIVAAVNYRTQRRVRHV